MPDSLVKLGQRRPFRRGKRGKNSYLRLIRHIHLPISEQTYPEPIGYIRPELQAAARSSDFEGCAVGFQSFARPIRPPRALSGATRAGI
jgi:hypothetical protein